MCHAKSPDESCNNPMAIRGKATDDYPGKPRMIESLLQERLQKFQFLSYSATEMLNLPDMQSIYKYLCVNIQYQYPESIVLALDANEEKMKATFVEVAGLQAGMLKNIARKLGYQPIGKSYDLSDDHLEMFRSGDLVEFEGDLSAFSTKGFPKTVARLLQKALGIHRVYTIGISNQGKLFSLVYIFTLKQSLIADRDFLETFIKQAGIVMQRKLLEDKLRYQSAILDQIHDRITVTDLSGKITYVNEAEVKMMKFPADQLLGRSVKIYGHNPEKGPTQQEIIDATLQSGQWQGEVVNYASDGKEILLEVRTQVVCDSLGKPIGMCGISTDITKRRVMEDALRESEHFSHIVANSTPALLYIYDLTEGRNIWTNDAHKHFFERYRNGTHDLFFDDILQMLHPDDLYRVVAKTDKIINNHLHDHFDEEIRIKTEENSWKWMKILVSVFKRDQKGIPCQMIGALFDIDDQKKVEQELLIAKQKAEESDRLKTSFLMNMSHEIRTPMNSILGFLNLLNNPNLDEKGRKDYIRIMNSSGQRLLDTINSIIEVSKIESGRLEIHVTEVNMEEVMQYHFDLFSFSAGKKKLHLSIDSQTTGEDAIIFTDKIMLEGILTNLLNNAIKFTQTGGITFGNYMQGNRLVLYVKDSGIGIKPDQISKVFERFFKSEEYSTRTYEGSGLGLHICRAYAEALGGHIWVESEFGKGSTFFLSLPLNRKECFSG
jgi:PAS domain S-box-containing protein